jgi:hypothetical protein
MSLNCGHPILGHSVHCGKVEYLTASDLPCDTSKLYIMTVVIKILRAVCFFNNYSIHTRVYPKVSRLS